jgi:bla regulator protein blaR1
MTRAYVPLSFALAVIFFATTSSQPQSASAPSPHTIIYTNKKYGFRAYLPQTWKGYSILESTWSGAPIGAAQQGTQATQNESGPELTIRHPLWTDANPRQDIPIMIFTRPQWELIAKNELIVSPAPIGPGEIGRNAKYVFALPPRYNYAFPTGYQEVDQLVQDKFLRAY